MSVGEPWVIARIEGAPPVLRRRVQESITDEGAPAPIGSLAARLAAAARTVLDKASGGGAKRSAAIELLSADALLTLALLRQAEEDPEGLGQFAATVRMTSPTP